MQSAYTININDIEKTVKKAIGNGYTVTLEINGEYYDIDTNEQKYEIYNTWQGYEIRKPGRFGWYLYLKGISNGRAKWVTDSTYAKHYTTRDGAKRAIARIKEV